MNDTSQVFPQIFGSASVPLLLIVVALLTVLWINRKKLQQSWRNWQTRYCLNHLGLEQLSNVKCPDGMGHYFTIDRLLLHHDGISLLVYKQYPGNIFCSDHIDEWTQMLGQKSYNFKNPLFELDYQVKAVSTCLPDIDIDGYLFFDHNAEFPKGHPERVIHPQQIPNKLQRNHRHKVNDQVMQAWRTLVDMSNN